MATAIATLTSANSIAYVSGLSARPEPRGSVELGEKRASDLAARSVPEFARTATLLRRRGASATAVLPLHGLPEC